MPRKNTHDIVPEGCFDVDKEMAYYTLYYNGKPMSEREANKLPAKVSNEQLIKINIERGQPVESLSLEGVLIQEYPSIAEAARNHKLSRVRIRQVLKGQGKTAAGLKWRYKQ